MQLIDSIGYLAAGLVLVTFCMRSMRALRCVAILSNLFFIGYGYLGALMPIVVLHLLLLPINLLRLVELGLAAWRFGTETNASGVTAKQSTHGPVHLAIIEWITRQSLVDANCPSAIRTRAIRSSRRSSSQRKRPLASRIRRSL
jgi:hypothetical protein